MAEPNPNPNDPNGGESPTDPNSGGEEKGGTQKTFSQEDVDKVLAKRLGEEKAKMEAATQKAVADAQADWERQQKLTAEERASEESKKRADELANKEREIALRENRADAREMLQAKEISTELVDYIVDVDPEKTKENVEIFAKAWDKAVEEGVKQKVTGKTPKDNSSDSKNTQRSSSNVMTI